MDRLLTWSQIAAVVPLSRVQVSKLEKRGQFPARLQLGPGKVVWKESEILAWVESRQRGALPTPPAFDKPHA
jgi:prophage regulatory protein